MVQKLMDLKHIHLSPKNTFHSIQALPEARWWLPAAALPLGDVEVLKACVLGVDVVLWQIDSNWHAALDQCPHRGAALSAGCVKENTLQCPYHGWQFDAQGACKQIPALPEFAPPAGHGLTTFSVRVYGGMIWVQLRADAAATLPSDFYPAHTAVLQKVGMLHALTQAYDVHTSAPRAVENFLDVSHFGTVHEGWLGDAAHMEVHPYTVETCPQRAKALGVCAWQPQSQATLSQGAWVDYTYEIAHPYCAQLTKLPSTAGGLEESIAMWACPTSPTTCRVWFSLCMADVGQTAQAVKAFQHTIFIQDKPILEAQRPALLPLDTSAEKHSAADRMSAAYRALLVNWRISVGTC
jgi:phenylpropionate dioxygenase-like ring-hydroxylating dioxygenase large terminal subunit